MTNYWVGAAVAVLAGCGVVGAFGLVISVFHTAEAVDHIEKDIRKIKKMLKKGTDDE